MKRFSLLLTFLASLTAGCAKGPAGGPVVPGANRLTVNFTAQQPLSPLFFYDFAFDTDDDASDGPAAIIGTTTLSNGVVGGAFTLLVQYRGGSFLVFRRTDLGGGAERLERCSNAFITTPTAGGANISFTLNMDAVVDGAAVPPVDADRLFPAGVTRLDLNFVTTSEIIRDPANLSLKPFDALGEIPGAAGSYATFDVASTRSYRNADTVREPTGDADPGSSAISAAQLAQLDVTDFSIEVRRSS